MPLRAVAWAPSSAHHDFLVQVQNVGLSLRLHPAQGSTRVFGEGRNPRLLLPARGVRRRRPEEVWGEGPSLCPVRRGCTAAKRNISATSAFHSKELTRLHGSLSGALKSSRETPRCDLRTHRLFDTAKTHYSLWRRWSTITLRDPNCCTC